MDSRTLTRVAAVALLAVALTASLIAMSWQEQEDEPARAISAAPAIPPADPLREGQRRCQQMGEAAAKDPDCMAIWAETRDRFLGRDTGSRDAEH
ncbi:MAG: putative entry exclusion protein TrbK-alt [Paenirhodobacter sp.]|uniref:putative entry exclusion protein TrbK-alt n=1 Tax=Paenirhodobacter sp. TaxID=1965326 RepID=UPI003D0FE105